MPLPEQEPAFTVYDDIRQKLIAQGVPADQIAFIHEANTEVRKKELFSKVRTGQVRVLLGSTAKMGAGTNVQDRLVALHDLDCPWRPGDLAPVSYTHLALISAKLRAVSSTSSQERTGDLEVMI